MTKLTAKYASNCIVCARPIRPGSQICYEKGKGSWHADCQGKKAAPLNSRRPDQMISADADLSALAAKYGREIDGSPKLLSMMISDGKPGDVIPSKGRKLLLLAVGASRYYSADYLEDMDMFSMRPGRYSDAQAVAVLPTDQESADAAAIADRKARAESVKSALQLSYSAQTNIPSRPEGVSLTQIHGSSRMAGSETWYLGSDGIVYYCRSSYDDGPYWWRTSATPELLSQAKELGVAA